jgi:erythrocyte band 7 integral membrane protein
MSSADTGKTPVNGIPSASDHTPIVKVEPPRREDLQPSYAREFPADATDAAVHSWYGGMINTLGGIIGTCGAVPCCIICPNPYRPVEQGNVGLVTKFGRFSRAVDPGLVKVNPLSERLIQVDVKIQIVGMLPV